MLCLKHRKEVFMRTLEVWVIELLEDIKRASEKGENYNLHLESPAGDEIAKAYDDTKWIEIY